MLQIAVCDDEPFYKNKIKELLEEYLNQRKLCYSISLFDAGEELLAEKASAVKYDIAFIDINMENMDGLETAARLKAMQAQICIVFVTAFISYAPEGYKVGAVRYIMKDTLEPAIAECMDAVLGKLLLKYVRFNFVEGDRALLADNILYVESRKHKAVFSYLEAGIVTYQIYDKLDTIEKRLTDYGFLRIHKSYLVNMRHIKKISNYTAVLNNGETLHVPRRRFQTVKEAFAAYKGAM